jgi:DNA polymerase-3 subunit beta
MKIECMTDRIRDAVSKAEKITGKNLTLPVLSCMLFEAKKNEVIIKATNLDVGIEITIPVKVITEGIVAVPGTIITSFLNQITDNTVVLEVVENNLKVTSSSNTTIIKTLNSDDFPTIPHVEGGKKVVIKAKDFVKGVKAVWYSSATSSMKPELSSVYVYSDEDELFFVATDSFRLAEKKVHIKNSKDIGSILIPVKNIPEIMRTLEGCAGDVDIYIGKNQISFEYNGVYLTSRVVDGIFPDYKQIIPKSHTTSVVVLKQDLSNAFKIATIFSDKFNKLSIHVRPQEKQLVLATRNSDVGENTNTLEAVVEGEDMDINFNYKYITDSLQSIDSDSVSLEFSGLTKPLIMRPATDKSFTYLVMPINK